MYSTRNWVDGEVWEVKMGKDKREKLSKVVGK